MITVGLPIFNQVDVMHIALEGLCRQVDACDWELNILTEDDVYGIIEQYAARLKAAGCKDIIVQRLDYWIPLPMKWKCIGSQLGKDSVGMMLHAGDCYSHPYRIFQSWRAMEQGYDWYQEGVGYFYDVGNKHMSLYNHPKYYLPAKKSALNMCIAARHVKNLPSSRKTSSIDRLLFESIKTKNVYQTNQVHDGVDLHGKNNISANRGPLIENNRKPFIATDKAIHEIGLPDSVVEMINSIT